MVNHLIMIRAMKQRGDPGSAVGSDQVDVKALMRSGKAEVEGEDNVTLVLGSHWPCRSAG